MIGIPDRGAASAIGGKNGRVAWVVEICWWRNLLNRNALQTGGWSHRRRSRHDGAYC
jgi:hypothetical protein